MGKLWDKIKRFWYMDYDEMELEEELEDEG